jgi:hypothetical protein
MWSPLRVVGKYGIHKDMPMFRGVFPQREEESYMYEIIDNVPIPTSIRMGRRKYPFDTLNVGSMFCIPGKTKNTMGTHASTIGKRLNRRFQTKLIYMTETDMGWMPAEADAKGAELGIGVWRVA